MKVTGINSNQNFRGSLILKSKPNSNIIAGLKKGAESIGLSKKSYDVLVTSDKSSDFFTLTVHGGDKKYNYPTQIHKSLTTESIGDDAIKSVVRNYENYLLNNK